MGAELFRINEGRTMPKTERRERELRNMENSENRWTSIRQRVRLECMENDIISRQREGKGGETI